MGSTLAQFKVRVLDVLQDSGSAIYSSDTIDEALRLALAEYNQVMPQELETVITLPGDGREIDLSALTGLLTVTDVWWPYDSTATDETWPPNQVKGFHVWRDVGEPVLFLHEIEGDQPQTDDEVRLWYTANQTIENLDENGDGTLASVTTIRPDHESLIVDGAAGHAAMMRAEALIETSGTDLYEVGLLGSWAVKKVNSFRFALGVLRGSMVRQGPTWGKGWSVDKWDRRETDSNW